MFKFLLSCFLFLALLGVFPHEVSAREVGVPTRPVYFSFTDGKSTKRADQLDAFIIKLDDPDKIRTARAILAGKEQATVHIMGKIISKKVSYNQDWSFYLAPHSISFFEYAMEVCDASISYTEEHLDEVGGSFLPNNIWCPWSSRVMKELRTVANPNK
ncbi:MAG: calmodulin-binding protein [bacterium]